MSKLDDFNIRWLEKTDRTRDWVEYKPNFFDEVIIRVIMYSIRFKRSLKKWTKNRGNK